MKKSIRNLSIVQNILLATLGIVTFVLAVTSLIYYSIFSVQTNSLVESRSREINKQIVLNYESYINSIIETANYVHNASLNLDIEDSYSEIRNIYQINSDIKKDIVSIFLFDENSNKLLGNDIRTDRAGGIITEPWFYSAVTEKDIFHFSTSYNQSISANKDEQVISVSKLIDYTLGGRTRKGILLIELNFETLLILLKLQILALTGIF